MFVESAADGRCKSCGTFTQDWVDERGRVLREPPLKVELSECWGCAAMGAARERFEEQLKDRSYRLVWVPNEAARPRDRWWSVG